LNSVEIINSLAPEKRAIFVSGDPGVASIQQDLRRFKLQLRREGTITQSEYENPNGVFLRFSIDGVTQSGIIQTENENETRGLLLHIPPRLQEKSADLLTILNVPLRRIPLFPFFTILEEFQLRELIEEMSKQYWSDLTNEVEGLKTWYLDFIRFRREIINTEIPKLEASVPSWMGNLKIYVLYNEKDRVIATRYYRNAENKDVVLVKETSKPVGLRTEEVFSEVFTLPSKQAIISGSVKYSKIGEKAFSEWNHPYFAAVRELREQVEKFNREQPSVYYDAHTVSPSLIHNWTHKELWKKRLLANKFPEFKRTFKPWLKPVQVLLVYFIDEAKEGRITGGTISAHYITGPKDEIIVKRVKNKENLKWREKIVKEYFPQSEGKLFSGFHSVMTAYLSKKLGADY